MEFEPGREYFVTEMWYFEGKDSGRHIYEEGIILRKGIIQEIIFFKYRLPEKKWILRKREWTNIDMEMIEGMNIKSINMEEIREIVGEELYWEWIMENIL